MLHPAIKLEVKGVIEGNGLVTTKLIKAGEVVSRLEPDQPKYKLSEVMTWSQEKQDDLMHYCYQCDEDWMVCEDGIERFMNHSCDPNTWWADSDTMIARRDILPGEELTYDYSTTEIVVPFKMECHCGADNCRGVITNKDYLDRNWQLRFGKYLPEHTLKAIAESKK